MCIRDRLAADVGMWADGGGKRPAATGPVMGHDIVLKLHRSLAVLFGKYGSTLVHTGTINGLPGFVTREADGEFQTTALELEDGKITAIYLMRNPDPVSYTHLVINGWNRIAVGFDLWYENGALVKAA